MGEALKEADAAQALGEVPIGAVIVADGGEIIGRGHNLREVNHDATAHAEMIAIHEACARRSSWRLTHASLFVTLEPCPMCAGAIINARLAAFSSSRMRLKNAFIRPAASPSRTPGYVGT